MSCEIQPRAPQPPTNRAPNDPARPTCAKENIKNGRFRAIILILWSGSKSSGTQISEDHLGTLFALFLRRQNFWYPHFGEPIRHLFRVINIDRRGSRGPLRTKKCNFDPKCCYLGPKVIFLFWNRDFSSKGHITNTWRSPRVRTCIQKLCQFSSSDIC